MNDDELKMNIECVILDSTGVGITDLLVKEIISLVRNNDIEKEKSNETTN